MTYNAARHFDARPDGHGGVTLTPRFRVKVRDQAERFLPKSELRDEEGYEGPINTPSRSAQVRNRIFTFGPLAEGQSYEFEDLSNGLVAVVLVSPVSDYPGDGGRPSNGTTDARTAYLAGTLGGEARQLATMNSINRRYFRR